ncbi:MAG: molybdopterin-dependent oxidoreductase, partial [Chloroflexi bacterium]|nr:molybdopterin-dependent oxidoreductase [Chloroflexota bacterium]
STYIAGDLVGKKVGLPSMGAFNTPVLIYNFSNSTIFQHDQSDFADAIRTGWLRSPAQFQTTFAMESFMDEVAAAAGIDPVQFRLQVFDGSALDRRTQRRRAGGALGGATVPFSVRHYPRGDNGQRRCHGQP